MDAATSQSGAEPARGRSWWHVLGKVLLVAAPLVGAIPPGLLYLLMGIPWRHTNLPKFLWLPLVATPVASLAVIFEVRFARLLVAASCLFLFFGPMEEFEPGGPLHGGEIVFGLHAVGGVAACLMLLPGLLLWRRKPARTAAADADNPWSRPTAYPRAGRTGLK